MSSFDAITPISRPIPPPGYYDRLSDKEKAKMAESYFWSIYIDQVYNTESVFIDEEEEDDDEQILSRPVQYDVVQQQLNQVMADELARQGILGLDRYAPAKEVSSEER